MKDSLPMRKQMEEYILGLQDRIVTALEKFEDTKFLRDRWERPNNEGYGISSVLQCGKTFEKAGVNISVVSGTMGCASVRAMRHDHKALHINLPHPGTEEEKTFSIEYFACGLSLVIHPRNPKCPTVHQNYRYFEVITADGEKPCWWFGGGADLTPSYLFEEDAVYFHKTLKDACDIHDPSYYPRFKSWCDEYFYIKHREEARGIGGIFFDDFDEKSPEEIFAFVKDVGDAFIPAYCPLVEKRKDEAYTDADFKFQKVRRGRYVEFNLIYDRGTQFGLRTPNARVESILISLPETACWYYQFEPTEPEHLKLLKVLKKPIEWV